VPSGRPCWRWGLAETTAAERAMATAAVFMMGDGVLCIDEVCLDVIQSMFLHGSECERAVDR
jgi:hypothetical protein